MTTLDDSARLCKEAVDSFNAEQKARTRYYAKAGSDEPQPPAEIDEAWQTWHATFVARRNSAAALLSEYDHDREKMKSALKEAGLVEAAALEVLRVADLGPIAPLSAEEVAQNDAQV